jgi:hypothetical protein
MVFDCMVEFIDTCFNIQKWSKMILAAMRLACNLKVRVSILGQATDFPDRNLYSFFLTLSSRMLE